MNDNNVNGDNNNNNNNINGVIDEFDLSEADSEIEDDVIVKKKQTDNNTTTNTTTLQIQTMLSKDDDRDLTFESIDISDDEEDENKKATVDAIKRIALWVIKVIFQ